MSLTRERAAIGLSTPSWAAKQKIWADVQVPLAGIRSGYTPGPSAARAHQSDALGVGVSGGWRAGKSLGAAMEGVTWEPFADLVWLVAVDYERTRQEFTYMAQASISLGLAQPSKVSLPLNKYQPCAMRTITGCLVETISLSADPKKVLTAKPPDLIIVCEPGLIENLYNQPTAGEESAGDDVMQLMWGRVAERRGRIWLAGTSDSASEDWYRLWKEWHAPNLDDGESFSMPTWENLHRFPKGEQETIMVRYLQKYGREAYLAHFGGIPSSPAGLVLKGYWRPDLLIDPNVEFDKALPVEIAIDPNYSLGHRYAIMAIQEDGADIRLIDEVAVEGCTHDEVVAMCKERAWWPNVIGGTMDPYAIESHVFGAPPPIQYWRPLRLRAEHRPRVATTVQALMEAMVVGDLGRPRLRVHPSCERFIWEATHWKVEGRMGAPSKENCDALKALGYWLVDKFYVERAVDPIKADADNVATGALHPSYAVDWQFDL